MKKMFMNAWALLFSVKIIIAILKLCTLAADVDCLPQSYRGNETRPSFVNGNTSYIIVPMVNLMP